ncbi:MAG: hypothetical protein RJB14_2944 [Pseudomonadota bacterium]|jgi:hypothetical protein
MKKGTILRNDAPHAVQMPEGSKVASRKVKKDPAAVPVPDEAAPAPAARKSVSAQVKSTKDKPTPVKVAAKTRAKPRAKAPSPAVKASAPEPALPNPVAATRTLPVPLDEAAIWEKDNPVKSRMNQLKARNALLEEQLQRLQSPFQARGKKP